MKTRVVIALATAALVGLGVAWAQQRDGQPPCPPGGGHGGPGGPGHPGGPPHPPHPPHPGPLMMALDTERDGALSADEIAAAATQLLTLDTDGDGALSREELRPPHPPQQDPPDPAQIVQHLMQHDQDNDGLLSTLELLPPHARILFAEADTNGDGLLSADELTTWFENRPDPQELTKE
jgi:hypothetical protein